jgi:uncharacterized protein (TIGR03067 family)
MKRMALAVALLAVVGVGSGGQEFANGDRQKLQGEWDVVSVAVGGKEIPLPDMGGMKLTFKGDKTFSSHNPKEELPFKLDETRKPKRIEIAKGANGVSESRGIYHLDGDTLKIAMSMNNRAETPASFDAQDIIIMTLRRAQRTQ